MGPFLAVGSALRRVSLGEAEKKLGLYRFRILF